MGRRTGCRFSAIPWLLAGLMLVMQGESYAKEECLKLVFNEYCLGGDIQLLAKKRSDVVFTQREGERLALVYPDGKDRVYVLGYRGRIYKVVRKYSSATLLTFEELLGLLTRKYGSSNDISVFPGYARSQASKIGAIRRGDARAAYLWQPAGQSWRIRLNWTREFGVSVEYVADHLAGEQGPQEGSGF